MQCVHVLLREMPFCIFFIWHLQLWWYVYTLCQLASPVERVASSFLCLFRRFLFFFFFFLSLLIPSSSSPSLAQRRLCLLVSKTTRQRRRPWPGKKRIIQFFLLFLPLRFLLFQRCQITRLCFVSRMIHNCVWSRTLSSLLLSLSLSLYFFHFLSYRQ